jgi:hypothetical protein
MAALVSVLTALAVLIVLATRLRWGGLRAAGDAGGLTRPAFWHTVCGVLGFALWTTFLLAPPSSVLGSAAMGVFGLGFWWLVVIVGLLLLARRLSRGGRHARAGGSDPRSDGPWLPLLTHGGMVLIAIVMTWAYVMQKV